MVRFRNSKSSDDSFCFSSEFPAKREFSIMSALTLTRFFETDVIYFQVLLVDKVLKVPSFFDTKQCIQFTQSKKTLGT